MGNTCRFKKAGDITLSVNWLLPKLVRKDNTCCIYSKMPTFWTIQYSSVLHHYYRPICTQCPNKANGKIVGLVQTHDPDLISSSVYTIHTHTDTHTMAGPTVIANLIKLAQTQNTAPYICLLLLATSWIIIIQSTPPDNSHNDLLTCRQRESTAD